MQIFFYKKYKGINKFLYQKQLKSNMTKTKIKGKYKGNIELPCQKQLKSNMTKTKI